MKISIRKGVFETNSSSTHSLTMFDIILKERVDENLTSLPFKIV